ncbi:MAG: DUF4388 domain-containing protein [Candidatus Dormibacteria bacterium]
MQSSGTLAELSLEGILDTVQKDRATGTLHIRSAEGEATLYFLFGHLFHAVDGGDAQGEPVVHTVLGWSEGNFTFDAKAKLPAEETIKVSTAELLAKRDASATASSNGTAAHADSEDAVSGGEDAEASGDEQPSEPADDAPEVQAAETPSEAAAGPEQRRRRTDQLPDTRPPETMVLYPMPRGKTIHEGLTAGFVDFPKLLRSLSKDKHSGYVRLSGEAFTGVLLFSSGAVVEALYDGDDRVSTGSAAFHQVGERIDEGEGALDVVHLTPEMVTGIYQLLTANSIYDRLLARFIKAEALLEYLTEQGTSGAVIVRHEDKSGIVLFREGEVLGAYTDESREVAESPEKVIALCEEATAEIEVRGGPVPATLPVMEPDVQGGLREVPSGSTPAERPRRVPAAAPTPKPAPESEAEPEPEPGPAVETAPAAADEAQDHDDETPSTDKSDGARKAGEDGDLGAAINEMAGRADSVLGTRSKKVKELLYASPHNREDIDATIEKIAELSIMFVDPSKLSSLAEEFRQIAGRTG